MAAFDHVPYRCSYHRKGRASRGWEEFVTLAIAAGIAVGILNNPEKKDGF
jgi:hypothetical protein